MTKKRTFLGLQIPEELSKALSKDAKRHFRNKSQHILWICNNYLGISDLFEPSKDQEPKDVKDKIELMKNKYYKEEE
jgi:hypothetical protein